jgi:hypothetical protein
LLLVNELMDKQVVSKQRVVDHGEVYTGKREVNAMLDLVKDETQNVESRFLEPACGTGNFLTEILERKLRIVEFRYQKSQFEFERNAVLAVTSIYGIDILEDNVKECRQRLFEIFDRHYTSRFKKAKNECREAVKYILDQNIIHGDALTLKTVGVSPQPIVFAEWSPVKGSMLKRRDFAFNGLIAGFLPTQRDMFPKPDLFSDLGDKYFEPRPIRDYPLIHFLKVADVEKQ